MIKQKDKLLQSYTNSDLKCFELLEDYRKYNVHSIDSNKSDLFSQPIHYTKSDQKQFLKLMNFNQASSEEKIIDYSMNKEVETNSSKENLLDNHFYNESDLKKFNKLRKPPLQVDSYSSRYLENKKEDSKIDKTHYKIEDLKLFNRIFESKENNNKNSNHKNLKSTIERDFIKILDFDKLLKHNKINSKKMKEEIKIVYFD